MQYTQFCNVSGVGVKQGDTVYVTRSGNTGLQLHAHRSAFRKALTAVDMVMDENQTLLQSLAR